MLFLVFVGIYHEGVFIGGDAHDARLEQHARCRRVDALAARHLLDHYAHRTSLDEPLLHLAGYRRRKYVGGVKYRGGCQLSAAHRDVLPSSYNPLGVVIIEHHGVFLESRQVYPRHFGLESVAVDRVAVT